MTEPTTAPAPTHFTDWQPITDVPFLKDDKGADIIPAAADDTNVPPLDRDLPGGARLWRLRDITGNIYRGKRTRWNKTGWAADFTNQPLTPAFYAPIEDTLIEAEGGHDAVAEAETEQRRGPGRPRKDA